MKIVLEGGPLDGQRLEIEGDPASPPPVYVMSDPLKWPVTIRHYYTVTSVVRPWLDQTWGWVYKFDGSS